MIISLVSGARIQLLLMAISEIISAMEEEFDRGTALPSPF
jgi:hypothetical protein